MSNNINYEELKIFITKHKIYFGKNLDSALKVIENAEQSKSTTKPIDILNRLDDLNMKRGDAKFNSEVRPELRKLLGLPLTLPKHDKVIRLIQQVGREVSTHTEEACTVVDGDWNVKADTPKDPENLYVEILNTMFKKNDKTDLPYLSKFKYYLRTLLAINTEAQAKKLEKKLNKVIPKDETEIEEGAFYTIYSEFSAMDKQMPDWCENL